MKRSSRYVDKAWNLQLDMLEKLRYYFENNTQWVFVHDDYLDDCEHPKPDCLARSLEFFSFECADIYDIEAIDNKGNILPVNCNYSNILDFAEDKMDFFDLASLVDELYNDYPLTKSKESHVKKS